MKYVIDDQNKNELGLEYVTDPENENSYDEWDISPFFPELLQELLDDFEVSQIDLATFLGKGKSSINNYVDGSSIPNKELLVKVAEYFSLDSNYFFVKASKTHPNSVMHEIDRQFFSAIDIPIISNTLPPYGSNSFFRPDNYVGVFSLPPTVQPFLSKHNSKLYAVSMDYETISDANASIGALAVFFESKELNDGDLAVVFLPKEHSVLVRRVNYRKKQIIFSCDQSTDSFDFPASNGEFRILGKVILINQCTYFR